MAEDLVSDKAYFMKEHIPMSDSLKKNVEKISIFLLVALFIYMFSQNFVMSENWPIVILRKSDDFAMFFSVYRLQNAIMLKNWVEVFSFFDYAYGFGFWLLNSLLLWPFFTAGNAQTIIVAGREISLLFGFANIYIIGLIVKRINGDSVLKYMIMILAATMPVFAMWTMRYQVNMQYVFWGLLSFYFLIREPELTFLHILYSAIFGGMMVGFKLMGVLLVPLLGLTLIWQLKDKPKKKMVLLIGFYLLTFFIVTIMMADPILFFPAFFKKEIIEAYSIFSSVAETGTLDQQLVNPFIVFFTKVMAGFYLSIPTSAVIFFLFIKWILADFKSKKYLSLFILLTILISVVFLAIMVKKAPGYSATYFLGVGLLLPFGLLGIDAFKWPQKAKYGLAVTLVAFELFIGFSPRRLYFNEYYALKNTPEIQTQILALSEMEKIILPLKKTVRVLHDVYAVFPLTQFDEGVSESYIYWNMNIYKDQDFDYIVLNSRQWAPPGSVGLELEAATRQKLHDTGEFYGQKYELIYSQNDIHLYQRLSK